MTKKYLAETKSWKLYKVTDAKGVYYDLYCKVNNCVTRYTHLQIDSEGNYELSYGKKTQSRD